MASIASQMPWFICNWKPVATRQLASDHILSKVSKASSREWHLLRHEQYRSEGKDEEYPLGLSMKQIRMSKG
jgi:hypothetical protein